MVAVENYTNQKQINALPNHLNNDRNTKKVFNNYLIILNCIE